MICSTTLVPDLGMPTTSTGRSDSSFPKGSPSNPSRVHTPISSSAARENASTSCRASTSPCASAAASNASRCSPVASSTDASRNNACRREYAPSPGVASSSRKGPIASPARPFAFATSANTITAFPPSPPPSANSSMTRHAPSTSPVMRSNSAFVATHVGFPGASLSARSTARIASLNRRDVR